MVKLRVAFVGYRDYDDPKPIECVDFAPLASGTFESTVAGGRFALRIPVRRQQTEPAVNSCNAHSFAGKTLVSYCFKLGMFAFLPLALLALVPGVCAEGGADSPEDVFSGLEAVGRLAWASQTRLLVHIADSPMHGRAYNDAGAQHKPRADSAASLTTLLALSASTIQHTPTMQPCLPVPAAYRYPHLIRQLPLCSP